MAKYTELLSEYLENGHTLPSIFEEIEGFSEMFLSYYIDKEIGFETETLFEIKLNMYANMYVPKYKERLEDLVSARTHANNPIKVRYSVGATTLINGQKKTKTTELPFDSDEAEPNIISESDSSTDTNNNTLNNEESGYTVDEALKIVEALNKEVNIVILKLLKAFSKCFMAVY